MSLTNVDSASASDGDDQDDTNQDDCYEQPLDPILTLQIDTTSTSGSTKEEQQKQKNKHGAKSLRSSSAITSLCFLGGGSNAAATAADFRQAVEKEEDGDIHDDDSDESNDDDDDSSSGSSGSSGSDEDDHHLQFRCRSLLLDAATAMRRTGNNTKFTRAITSTSACSSSSSLFPLIQGRYIASCHADGSCLLWSLEQRRVIVHDFLNCRSNNPEINNTGPGLHLQRLSTTSTTGHHHESDNDNSSQQQFLLYQTRDKYGTVSLHDVNQLVASNLSSSLYSSSSSTSSSPSSSVMSTIHTFSQTFCKAAPCHGNTDLIALPSADDGVGTVRDWRVPNHEQHAPIAILDPATMAPMLYAEDGSSNNGLYSNQTSYGLRKYGMLTSLAMSESSVSFSSSSSSSKISQKAAATSASASSGPIVACGYESGHVFFYDLRYIASAAANTMLNCQRQNHYESCCIPCSSLMSLSKDPILALDMMPSSVPTALSSSSSQQKQILGSVVTVAGMAGTTVSTIPSGKDTQGQKPGQTIALMKTTVQVNGNDKFLNDDTMAPCSLPILRTKIRSRWSTCSASSEGKPGVSLCRFRSPDGRLVAVGGWDYRLRIFDRSVTSGSNHHKNSANPLAILRGHCTSVNAMDWAHDADSSGLLATGAEDGLLFIWQCFPKQSQKRGIENEN